MIADARDILHCDCNSFYASVEETFRPELRRVPMAVAGDPESRHGIILAKNELAKKFKIQTAETVWSAKKKCPDLVLTPPRHKIYGEFCERVNERVKREIDITISVGVSWNKIYAKLGSDYKKPNAVTEITRENYREIVFPLPAGDLFFVGRKTAENLAKIGVRTIGDIAACDRDMLTQRFGKQGERLHVQARPRERGRHSHRRRVPFGQRVKRRSPRRRTSPAKSEPPRLNSSRGIGAWGNLYGR